MSQISEVCYKKLRNVKIKFWNKKKLNITDYDPVFKVIYLGNVLTPWAKGENITEKPLCTLWKNYCSNVKKEIHMKLKISNSGLKAFTREHGLTEYWANRVTYCGSHPNYPKVFCWIYRHEGRKMKQELRCHAVLCTKDCNVDQMARDLQTRLRRALMEFRREKKMRQNCRNTLELSDQTDSVQLPAVPLRKQFLIKGLANFRPPLERSKSAPKLTSIIETMEESDHFVCDEAISESTSLDYEEKSSETSITSDNFDRLSSRLSIITINGTTIVNVQDYAKKNCDIENIVEHCPNPTISENMDRGGSHCQSEEDNISDESGYSENTTDTASSVKSTNSQQ